MGALALTGGRRATRSRDAGDGAATAVKQVLEGPETDNLAVLEAGDLGPRSPLRKLCEAASNAAAVPCYLADAEATARLVRRSAERRVGKECVSTCRSRGSPSQ